MESLGSNLFSSGYGMSPFLDPHLADLCPPPGSVPQEYSPQTYCTCLAFLLFIEIRDSALSPKPLDGS